MVGIGKHRGLALGGVRYGVVIQMKGSTASRMETK